MNTWIELPTHSTADADTRTVYLTARIDRDKKYAMLTVSAKEIKQKKLVQEIKGLLK